jgi:hypothetical protein
MRGMVMRDLLPLQQLAKSIIKGLGGDDIGTVKVQTVTHEDNLGCLKLTKMDPGWMMPRSKHYGVKYHWFHSKRKPNNIEISYIKSKDQCINFLTKSLRVLQFEAN